MTNEFALQHRYILNRGKNWRSIGTLFVCLLISLMPLTSSGAESNALLKTYIIAGQSNADGYGLGYGSLTYGNLNPNLNLNNISRTDLIPANSSIHIFKGDYDTALGSWQNLVPGFGISWNGVRFGPELSFGHDLHAVTDSPVAIIKYARGATSLAPATVRLNDWEPEYTGTNRYDYFINTIVNAKAAAAMNGWILDIVGVIWMQGESDSLTANNANSYEQNLRNFIANVRSDLDLPGLQFHIGEIANQNVWQFRQTIWDAQAAVSATDANVFLVSGRDLPVLANDGDGDGGIHYTTESQVSLGERFVTSVLANEPSSPPGGGNCADSLLTNGCFETGSLSPWSGNRAGISTQNIGFGRYAVQLGTGTNASGWVEQVVTGLRPNTQYRAEVWVGSNNEADVWLSVKKYGGSQQTQYGYGTTTYRKVQIDFTTGASNSSATIFCYAEPYTWNYANSVAYCDNFSLVEAKPPGGENCADGLLANGCFETGSLSPWSGNRAGISTQNIGFGTYTVQLGTGTSASGIVRQVVTGLRPSTQYRAEVWVGSNNEADVWLGAKKYGGSQQTQYGYATTTYRKVQIDFTTGASNSSAIIFCDAEPYSWNYANSVAYCDNFSLSEVN